MISTLQSVSHLSPKYPEHSNMCEWLVQLYFGNSAAVLGIQRTPIYEEYHSKPSARIHHKHTVPRLLQLTLYLSVPSSICKNASSQTSPCQHVLISSNATSLNCSKPQHHRVGRLHHKKHSLAIGFQVSAAFRIVSISKP